MEILARRAGRAAITAAAFALLHSMIPAAGSAQTRSPMLPADPTLSRELSRIVEEAGLAGDFDVGADGIEQVSFAVVEMGDGGPVFGGVGADNFIYPASVYKMYVAAEVLRRVEAGDLEMTTRVRVADHNAVDTAREVLTDPRPLLTAGDSVTLGYLLDLMITRSDNTAANVLIDVAGRPALDSLMHRYGWHGSEVTRKFLPRADEDPGYAEVRGTETSARHAAEFLYLIASDRLVSPWVSRRMMVLLGGQLDRSKLASALPRSAMLHHKTGWFSYWTHDVAVVRDGEVEYVVALFTPVPQAEALPRIRSVGTAVHTLMARRARER